MATVAKYGDEVTRASEYGIEKRRQCEQLRASLDQGKSTFVSHWRELSQYILPRKAHFQSTDANKGDKRNQSIIDSTATEAAGICAAGMHSGVTSPARPWFKLAVSDPQLNESGEVKQYLHEVETRMQDAMIKSNFYKVLPSGYLDLAVFGTCAFSIIEDDQTVFRCYDHPVGSFAIGNDDRREVRYFVRSFQMTVGQVVKKWGNLDANGKADFQRGETSNISINTQQLWRRGDPIAWIEIVHVIQPNVSYDGVKIESRYKKYEEIYYEAGTNSGGDRSGEGTGVLAHSGYDEFPVIVGRWEKVGEDVYGTNCPGMAALGDIKQLQFGEKKGLQALDKTVNPPIVASPELMNAKVSVLPGDITYAVTREGMQGIKPIYQVQFPLNDLEAKQEQVRQRIRSTFKADLFLMLSQSDRREITAREIDERHEEKLLALGPTLEQINDDILDTSIDRIFGIMDRAGRLPDPPEVLQGQSLRVEYVSIMAQAQRMIGLASLERTLGFAGQAVQISPDAIDVLDIDQLMREHVEASGAPPKVLRSEDAVAEMRQQRGQAQQTQQAAENAPGLAGAVQSLGNTPTTGDSALAKLIGGQNARATLNATAQPAMLQ